MAKTSFIEPVVARAKAWIGVDSSTCTADNQQMKSKARGLPCGRPLFYSVWLRNPSSEAN